MEGRFRDFTRAVSKLGFQEATYTLTMPIPLTNPTSYVIQHSIDQKSGFVGAVDLDDMFVSDGSFRGVSNGKTEYRGWLYSIEGGGGLSATVRLICRGHGLPESQILKAEILLIGLAHVLHNGMCQQVIDTIRLKTNAQLTAREIAALKWTADGKTASDISKILSISRRTVEYHISSAMTKLGTPTRSSAVVKAHALGLLNSKL